jgi:hypothetical protein
LAFIGGALFSPHPVTTASATISATMATKAAASILDYTDEITRKTLPALGPALQTRAYRCSSPLAFRLHDIEGVSSGGARNGGAWSRDQRDAQQCERRDVGTKLAGRPSLCARHVSAHSSRSVCNKSPIASATRTSRSAWLKLAGSSLWLSISASSWRRSARRSPITSKII